MTGLDYRARRFSLLAALQYMRRKWPHERWRVKNMQQDLADLRQERGRHDR